jgi:L-alanine-DL-glutamate epimerase-like enolase superfamily enzyme
MLTLYSKNQPVKPQPNYLLIFEAIACHEAAIEYKPAGKLKISFTEIWKFSIPMHPFTIATGTMDYAQNIFIRIHVEEGLFGVGECSAFPMIAGETQATCFEMAKEFAAIWKGKDARNIAERLDELHQFTAFNSTAKSAFDMALYDLAAKKAGLPLYQFLGGERKEIETDLTIGIGKPSEMAQTAVSFKKNGVRIIKIKLGKNGKEDIERVERIREAVGDEMILRIDANQGWSPEIAAMALTAMDPFNIQFCEQPMRHWHDKELPALRKISPIRLMADESVFDHHDAQRLIEADACDFVNIKLAKSGGMLEAARINECCENSRIPCMMGGMLESRLALTSFAHFALAHKNIIFYDLDTCLLGHKIDPVIAGVRYRGYFLDVSETPGIGADVADSFLKQCQQASI